MKKIFKVVSAALKKALKAMFKGGTTALRYAGAAALMPLAAVGSLFGGHQMADDLPEPEVVTGPLALDEVEDDYERHELLNSRLLHRVQPYAPIYEFCATPSERRQFVNMQRVPLAATVWARKLTDSECARVRMAGLQSLCDHVSGKKLIPGVKKPPLPLRDFRHFLSFDDDVPLLERAEHLIAEAEASRQAHRITMH